MPSPLSNTISGAARESEQVDHGDGTLALGKLNPLFRADLCLLGAIGREASVAFLEPFERLLGRKLHILSRLLVGRFTSHQSRCRRNGNSDEDQRQ
jgi:hypothetical protein